MAEYCNDGRFKITRIGPWGGLDHYLPNNSKMTGFWVNSFNSDFKQKYGFSRITLPYYDAQSAINAGFAVGSIQLAFNWHEYQQAALVDGGEYYTDEPFTTAGASVGDIATVANYLHARGKRFGIGEQRGMFTDGGGLAILDTIMPYLDFITHTNYVGDQRDIWTIGRNRYGSKFDMVWIKPAEDLGELDQLFGHANNLGISKAFMYADPVSESDKSAFCEKAWRQGWLRRFDLERQDKWCCPMQIFDSSVCELDSSTLTGQIVEVYP